LAAIEKRARRQNALIVFEDESGVSLLPSVRATWAPRGHTPVLRHRFSWKRLSLAGALAYEPDGSDAHLVFQLRPGAYNDETLIEFLSLLNDVEQRPVLLIWDGLPSHRSRRMNDWIASQRHWLSVEPLLRTRAQSDRTDLGQPQIHGTCQSVLRHYQRGRRHR
jgi:hypothetical protein